jgi:bifunctional non-homologous end joining protein LigD
MAFDCLYLDGRDLRPEPLARRREVLDGVVDGGHLILPARRLPPDGLKAWDIVKARGYEGLVAKDEQSAYGAGRTRSWLKIKVRYEGVFTVGGILGRPDSFEGVLVGERVGRRLLYRGVVEWGIGRVTIGELLTRCRVAEASPFHDLPRARRATWLEPRVRVSVTYNEMMQGRLRVPVFRGFSSSSN